MSRSEGIEITLWLVLVFIPLVEAIKNVTVTAADPSLVYHGFSWETEACGATSCDPGYWVFLNFTGTSIYLQALPYIIGGNVDSIVSVSLDGGQGINLDLIATNTGSLGNASSASCATVAYAQSGLENTHHTINVTRLAVTNRPGGDGCWQLTGFIYTIPEGSPVTPLSPSPSPYLGFSTISLPTSATASSTTSSTDSNGTGSSGSFPAGTISGIAIGGAVGFACLLGILNWLLRRKKSPPRKSITQPPKEDTSGSSGHFDPSSYYEPSSQPSVGYVPQWHSPSYTPPAETPQALSPTAQGESRPNIYVIQSANINNAGRDVMHAHTENMTENVDSFNSVSNNLLNSHNTQQSR